MTETRASAHSTSESAEPCRWMHHNLASCATSTRRRKDANSERQESQHLPVHCVPDPMLNVLCGPAATWANPTTEESSVKNSIQSESAHHRYGSSHANPCSEEKAVVQTQPLLAKQHRCTCRRQGASQASLPANAPYLGPSLRKIRSHQPDLPKQCCAFADRSAQANANTQHWKQPALNLWCTVASSRDRHWGDASIQMLIDASFLGREAKYDLKASILATSIECATCGNDPGCQSCWAKSHRRDHPKLLPISFGDKCQFQIFDRAWCIQPINDVIHSSLRLHILFFTGCGIFRNTSESGSNRRKRRRKNGSGKEALSPLSASRWNRGHYSVTEWESEKHRS